MVSSRRRCTSSRSCPAIHASYSLRACSSSELVASTIAAFRSVKSPSGIQKVTESNNPPAPPASSSPPQSPPSDLPVTSGIKSDRE
eukprot:1015578-Prorocentrum_minimum.AAC.5